MAILQPSEYKYTADGVTRVFPIAFPYLREEEVYVHLDGLPTNYTLSASNQAVLESAPTSGTEVHIFRSTDARGPRHEFQHGSPLLPDNLDDNFTQILHVAQEIATVSEEALNNSSDALNNSSDALSIALGMETEFQDEQTRRESEFKAFLVGAGYQDLGEYAPGIEITAHNQYVTFGGQPYLLKPSIPVPYTTSGEWTGDDFKLIGDDTLRQDLANPDKGAAMVARGVLAVDSIADLLALPEGQRKEDLRYLVKGYHAGSGKGGGIYYYDPTRTSENNGGTVLEGFVWHSGQGVPTAANFGAVSGVQIPQNEHINNAIQACDQLVIDEHYYVDAENNVVMVRSDQVISWTGSGKLESMPASTGNTAVLRLQDVSNVTLNNPHIVGDKYTNTGGVGEWGICMDFRGASNITVNSPRLYDAWGDCIYIRRGEGISRNIVINDLVCARGRRQGISVISVDGLFINGAKISDIRSNDTDYPLIAGPHSAIDIEPNYANDVVDNVVINDLITSNCQGSSVNFSIGNLGTDPEQHNTTNITLNNHTDFGSQGSIAITTSVNSKYLSGRISLNNPSYYNSNRGSFSCAVLKDTVQVDVKNLLIVDHNRSGVVTPRYGSAVSLGRDADRYFDGDIGGITIDGLRIVCNSVEAGPIHGVSIDNANHRDKDVHVVIKNMTIVNKTEELFRNNIYRPAKGIMEIVEGHYLVRTSGTMVQPIASTSYLLEPRSTGTATILDDSPLLEKGFPDLTFTVAGSPHPSSIQVSEGFVLTDTDGTNLRRITSSTEGDKVTVRKMTGNRYIITEIHGKWTRTEWPSTE